jgi:hypothetical protein
MRYTDRADEGIFCENVRFVFKELYIYESPYGYRSELVGFSLQGIESGEN